MFTQVQGMRRSAVRVLLGTRKLHVNDRWPTRCLRLPFHGRLHVVPDHTGVRTPMGSKLPIS